MLSIQVLEAYPDTHAVCLLNGQELLYEKDLPSRLKAFVEFCKNSGQDSTVYIQAGRQGFREKTVQKIFRLCMASGIRYCVVIEFPDVLLLKRLWAGSPAAFHLAEDRQNASDVPALSPLFRPDEEICSYFFHFEKKQDAPVAHFSGMWALSIF